MQAKDAAAQLGITPRMLRHYEQEGLLDVGRSGNGYRSYSAADLRRAARIRDFIETGFSTREIRAMRACLDDAQAGPCHDGIAKMHDKLSHIDRLQEELGQRRDAILKRIDTLEAGLAANTDRHRQDRHRKTG